MKRLGIIFLLLAANAFAEVPVPEVNPDPTNTQPRESTSNVSENVEAIKDEEPVEWTMFKSAIGVNLVYINQPLTLTDFHFSINGRNMEELSKRAVFETVSAKGVVENVRLDTWVLPFWNVYLLGIVSQTKIPVQMAPPLDFVSSTLDGDTIGVGLGTVLAVGYLDNFWSALDGNYSWTDNAVSASTVKIANLTFRTGMTFDFITDESTNFWVGAMYTHIGGEDTGSLALSEMIASCDGLTGIAQDACLRLQKSTIDYSVTKSLEGAADLLVGAEQTYKDWSFKVESSLMINRVQVLGSVAYTFTDGMTM